MTSFERGELNANENAIVGTPARRQDDAGIARHDSLGFNRRVKTA